MQPTLFTIGHSTHPLERFVELLTAHDVRLLADVRRFPGSRKFPWFNQESLSTALPAAGIEYQWFEALGGRRGKSAERSTKNLGLRNESFRNYADYMLTPEFRASVAELLELTENKSTAIMCSESVFWRCHRRLVSDYLLVHGINVQHIMPSGELRPHTLTTGARVENGELNYPPPESKQTQLLFD